MLLSDRHFDVLVGMYESQLDTSNEVSSQLAFWFRIKEFKTDFQHSCKGDHLGFPISMILADFDLQITIILSIEPIGRSVQKKFKIYSVYILKLATVADILDFRSELKLLLIYKSPRYFIPCFE